MNSHTTLSAISILMVGRTGDDAMAATGWDGKSVLEDSSGQAGSIRAAIADAMGASGPRVENYEVAFADLLAPAGR